MKLALHPINGVQFVISGLNKFCLTFALCFRTPHAQWNSDCLALRHQLFLGTSAAGILARSPICIIQMFLDERFQRLKFMLDL